MSRWPLNIFSMLMTHISNWNLIFIPPFFPSGGGRKERTHPCQEIWTRCPRVFLGHIRIISYTWESEAGAHTPMGEAYLRGPESCNIYGLACLYWLSVGTSTLSRLAGWEPGQLSTLWENKHQCFSTIRLRNNVLFWEEIMERSSRRWR